MSQGHAGPTQVADSASVRRLGDVRDGRDRAALRDRLRGHWNLLLSNLTRTVPRLRSDDVTGLIAPDGTPTLVPPWDLPLDVVWGTDRPDNGRMFVLFAVEDEATGEKAVFVVFEQRGPTSLPIGVARLAGTITLVGNQLADTEDTLRGLLSLYRNGRNVFRRQAGDGPHLEETPLSLQFTKTGFAPMARTRHPTGELQS